MKIEILLDHPSGLKKGQVTNVPDNVGKILIDRGQAKELKAASGRVGKVTKEESTDTKPAAKASPKKPAAKKAAKK